MIPSRPFALHEMFLNPAVEQALEAAGVHLDEMLERHRRGDVGNCEPDLAQQLNEAFSHSFTSLFSVPGYRCLRICTSCPTTEDLHEHPRNTTLVRLHS
jgi:hypothetical protein